MSRPSTPVPGLALRDGLQQARRLLKERKPDRAAETCRAILAKHPGHSETLHMLGLIALEGGRSDDALENLRQACAARDAHASCFCDFAELCRRASLLEEGERAARTALRLDPKLVGAWNNLGIILQEAGRQAESKACLERVLTLTPESPEAHNNYANTCKRLKLLIEAERHWLRALELREAYPEPHSNLATLYSDLGAFDRAAYHARRAITLAPRFADAYLNLALVEGARGDDPAALATLDRLLALAPHYAAGLAAKALTLQKLDRLEEALPLARGAVAAAPGNGQAVYALGQLSQAVGDVAGARDAYERATRLPGLAAQTAASSLALLLMETGDAAGAERAFTAALAAYPRSAPIYFNRADLKRYAGADDPDIAAMLSMLDGADQTMSDQMLLHFALGAAFLQIGDGGRAFFHLDVGNRMKRSTFSYDAANTSRWMEDIARVFNAEAFARLSTPGPARSPRGRFQPVFIIGVPRAGTTLVEQILASHPAIFGAGELQFVANAAKSLGEYPSLAANLDGETLLRMGDGYCGDIEKRFGTRLAPEHRYVIDKMPANFLYAGLIRLMFPDARIIHCRRDPVDTCLSCYSKLFTREQFFTYDQTELGQFHRDYQRLMSHWRAVLSASNFIEVDYEAVVDDLEGQARRLLAFLDLPWAPACLDFHRTPRAVRTASVNQVRQPIYRASVGRWKPHAAWIGPLLRALQVSA